MKLKTSKFILATALVAAPLHSLLLAAEGNAPKRILFFSKSSGYEHSVIRSVNGQPSYAQGILEKLGQEHGFEFTFTKDGRVFTPENLAKYDAFFFYTTGDLTKPGNDGNPPMTPEGKAAFLEAIHSGKGFVGTHSASDTFHSPGYDSGGRYRNDARPDPYIKMLGGEFIIHGAQQRTHLIVADPAFPGLSAVPANFGPFEEWYSLKNFAPDLHVLLVQDTHAMKGHMYRRPPYPETWAHLYGKGRVFYTSMGHREDIWTNPVFQQVLVGGLNWVVHNVDADVSPNLKTVAPGARVMPPAK